MSPESLELVRRYLAGELNVDAAAQGLQKAGDLALQYSPGEISTEERERMETLFGRVFWLSMREVNPDRVPETPFGAAEFRAIMKEMSGNTSTENPEETPE